jgi:hypothetical protein
MSKRIGKSGQIEMKKNKDFLGSFRKSSYLCRRKAKAL